MKYEVISPVRVEGRLFVVGETLECDPKVLAGAQHCVKEIAQPKPAPKPQPKPRSKYKAKAAE